MRVLPTLRYSEWTLRKKLFGYMLVLAAILLFALMTGLLLFGRFDSTEKSTFESLDIQMEIFEKDITTHFDYLAAAGIQLSENTTILLENYFSKNQITFADLTDSKKDIHHIQQEMLEPLKQKLLQEDCSGAFVMLDTTVNSSLPDANLSKTGLYLQVSGYETADQNILLYRGLSNIAKEAGIMPHRKWRLEYRTDLFPNYEEIMANAALPLEKTYRYADFSILPGTSEKVMLLVVPIIGSDDTYYGICGFEVSASYFMTYHSQPTKIPHMTCLLNPGTNDTLDTSLGLSCGVANGFYRAPQGLLTVKNAGGGLFTFTGDATPYIGVRRNIRLSPNNTDYSLIIMILKRDYDLSSGKNALKNIILWMLLLFFSINCCYFFSQKFLSPVLKDLDRLKTDKLLEAQSNIPEINDLFAFLEERDKAHEKSLTLLTKEKQSAQNEKNRLQAEYERAQAEFEKAQAEISRLAYSRKQEIDPDDYAQFMAGIDTLTVTERKIFHHYLDGKSVKEIIEIAAIKESTLRYHNRNIYSKLGVNSLKQLLRYAALMKREES